MTRRASSCSEYSLELKQLLRERETAHWINSRERFESFVSFRNDAAVFRTERE